jgi:formate dehydrogenase subunit gamma
MKSLSGLCLALLLSAAGAALAQQAPVQGQSQEERVKEQQQRAVTQPGNNAPVWREVRSGQSPYTNTTVKGRETEVLVQSWGDTWRRIRNGPVTFWGGWLVLAAALAVAALYFTSGTVQLHDKPSGRMIRRFTPLEQVAHWCMGISFVVLGISGLVMLFGKHVLLPVIGYTLFAWLTALSKNLHNFVGPFFIVSTVIFVALFARDNLPRAYDIQWFGRAWGYVTGRDHPPSGKFNGGEKIWFWSGVVGLSIVVSVSGVILLFPNFDQTRAVMQQAWIWHAVAAVLFMCMSFGHIYLGTLGVAGAYQAMRTGYVDEVWAKEHHEIWYNEVKSGQRSEAAGGAVPAGAPHQEEKS